MTLKEKDDTKRLKDSLIPFNVNDVSENSDIINNVKDSMPKRNGIFMLFQTIFVLSFIHMDKLPYHIEGIIGVFVLLLTTRMARFKISPSSLPYFALSIAALSICEFTESHELNAIKIFELVTCMAFLINQQFQILIKDPKRWSKMNDIHKIDSEQNIMIGSILFIPTMFISLINLLICFL